MAANVTYIHTTSANAVTLVWGSLRLAPITCIYADYGERFVSQNHEIFVHVKAPRVAA